MGAVVNIITDRFRRHPRRHVRERSRRRSAIKPRRSANWIPSRASATTKSSSRSTARARIAASTRRPISRSTMRAPQMTSSCALFTSSTTRLDARVRLFETSSRSSKSRSTPIRTTSTTRSTQFPAPTTRSSSTIGSRISISRSVSNDGNSVFQLIPWFRSTRVNYLGDLGRRRSGHGPELRMRELSRLHAPTRRRDPDYVNNVGLELSEQRQLRRRAHLRTALVRARTTP